MARTTSTPYHPARLIRAQSVDGLMDLPVDAILAAIVEGFPGAAR